MTEQTVTIEKIRNPVKRPVLDAVAERWSPRAFADTPVDKEVLLSLFEAARWAASSYNEQPWRFIVAFKEDSAAYTKLLSCLRDSNQSWAKSAPILMLSLAKTTFSNTDGTNNHARHDLGAAVAQLTLEATSRDLYLHQMAGIHPDKARGLYEVSDDYDVVAAIALGYLGELEQLPEDLQKKELRERERKPLEELVFEEKFGESSSFVK